MPKQPEPRSYSSGNMLRKLPADCGPSNKHDRAIINDLLLSFFYFNTTRTLFPNLPSNQLLKQLQNNPKNYLTQLLQSIEALHQYFTNLPYQYFQCTQYAVSWIEQVAGESTQTLEKCYLKAAAIYRIGAEHETFERRREELLENAEKYYEQARQLYHDRPYPTFYEKLSYICGKTPNSEKLLQTSLTKSQQFFQQEAGTVPAPPPQRSPGNNLNSVFGFSTLRLRVSASSTSEQDSLLSHQPSSPPVQG